MLKGIISIIVFVLVLVVGCIRKTNIGILGMAAAFALGVAAGLTNTEIMHHWPTQLFVLLLGVTFFFAILQANGTMSKLVNKLIRPFQIRPRLFPLCLFGLSVVIAGVGPGNIAACAILLPLAMNAAQVTRLSPLFISLIVITGSNIGGLSPLAPTGIIAIEASRQIGADIVWSLARDMAIVGTAFLVLYYFVSGQGRKPGFIESPDEDGIDPFTFGQKLSIGVTILVLCLVPFVRFHLGLICFAGSALLLSVTNVSEKYVLHAVPWGVLIMVSGVAVLVGIARDLGGIDIISEALARLMGPKSAAPLMLIISGLFSTVSSASGVVLPTLIPTIPSITSVLKPDYGNEIFVSAIVIGAHVVTVSPFSTLGAIALSSLPAKTDPRSFFVRSLLVAFAGLLFSAVLLFSSLLRLFQNPIS